MSRIKVQKNISYDDKKKVYYVTLYHGVDNNGKGIKETKTFDHKKDAQNALKLFEANKLTKRTTLPTALILEDWLIYWLDNIKGMNCEETTLYGYRNIINNHLIPDVGSYKLQNLSPTIINKYLSKKRKDLSNNTIRKHYDLLKDALKHAVDEEKIFQNPIDKIKPIKIQKSKINFYNITQLQKLFEIVENDRMEIVVKLAGLLAMRREEISGLKWENINFENKTISIKEARTQAGKKTIIKGTKNKSSTRILHAPEEILYLLAKIKGKQDANKELLGSAYKNSGYIICWEDGRPYRPNYLSDLFKKIIDDNELPPLRLHDLRHTFASIANELGINLYDISKALGHSQVGTTSNIYTHMFDMTQKKAISKVSDAMSLKEKNNPKS